MSEINWGAYNRSLWLERVRALDLPTVSSFQKELTRHRLSGLQTNIEGALIVLRTRLGKGEGDRPTLEFLIEEFGQDRGSGQRNLTGMIASLNDMIQLMSPPS